VQERLERDALIIKSLGYGVAFVFFYFTLDGLNKPDYSWWPGMIGAVLFAGLGHLVSWAVARIPQNRKQE
jgi:hypothetical protein